MRLEFHYIRVNSVTRGGTNCKWLLEEQLQVAVGEERDILNEAIKGKFMYSDKGTQTIRELGGRHESFGVSIGEGWALMIWIYLHVQM